MTTTAEALRAVVLADILAEECKLSVAEDVQRAALAELAVQGAELQAAHDRAAAVARAEFAAVPPLLEIVDGQPHRDALHELLRAREALIARRGEALAAALPEIVRGWDTARGPLDARALEIATEATALAESYASWHRLLSEARRAAEQPSREHGRIRGGPSERMRPRPQAADVLLAALGVDLCAPGPSDADVHAMLVTGVLDDGSGRIIVDRMTGNGRR